MDLNKINKVFFIGIGGIGISAAARILNERGKTVVGSDAVDNEITEQLRSEGIKVLVPQAAENLTADFDLVVYTVAIPPENPERKRARALGIPEITYPQLLSLLMINQYGIGVSGTNGKTTTTAMLGLIFLTAGLDPTIVVGSKVDYLGGNSRVGRGRYFIFESDEYRRAFAHYQPRLAVVTYITEDHLDYYRDLAEIQSAFNDYLKRVPTDGFLIINKDDQNSLKAINDCQAKVIFFGLNSEAEISAKDININSGQQSFLVYRGQEKLGQVVLSVPARYNIYNALAAISAALAVGIDFSIIQKALADFKGTWRRFQKIGEAEGKPIIVDYAHTPDAVQQTIIAAKEFYPDKRILVVFQPHQYSRTKKLFQEFTGSFLGADQLIISDIFYVVGRENPDDFNIDAKKLSEEVVKRGVKAIYGGDLSATESLVRQNLKFFDLILILGAGDIYYLAKKLIN